MKPFANSNASRPNRICTIPLQPMPDPAALPLPLQIWFTPSTLQRKLRIMGLLRIAICIITISLFFSTGPIVFLKM